MGILDDAIREHLDLKRKHGARDAELREIEDEAFGSGDQPDAFVGGRALHARCGPTRSDAGTRSRRAWSRPRRFAHRSRPAARRPLSPPRSRRPSGPPTPCPSPSRYGPRTWSRRRSRRPPISRSAEPPSQIPGQVELPGQDEIPGQERLDAEPGGRAAPSPSESLEELIAEEEPFPEDTAAPPRRGRGRARAPRRGPLEPQPDAQAPPEPESAVPDPPPPPPEPGTEPPGRARGRVDVPTQEHPPPGDTGDLPPLPGDEPELGRPDTTYEPPPIEPPSDEARCPTRSRSPTRSRFPTRTPPRARTGPQLYDFETRRGVGPADVGAPRDRRRLRGARARGGGGALPRRGGAVLGGTRVGCRARP